jgi:hypothetical protein
MKTIDDIITEEMEMYEEMLERNSLTPAGDIHCIKREFLARIINCLRGALFQTKPDYKEEMMERAYDLVEEMEKKILYVIN